MDLDAVRAALVPAGIDGWLLYDFRGSNPIARRLVGWSERQIGTRRWFYWIPAQGEPVGIVHAIEREALGAMPGQRVVYSSWRDLEAHLAACLKGTKRVAMEYSPGAAIPYVSRVDAGTIELVRRMGPEVVTSADLIQLFEARWSPKQKALHDRAAKDTLLAKDEAFALIRARLEAGLPIKESEVQAFIQSRFEARGLTTDHPCIVAVNDHASDPHFETSAGPGDRDVKKGDLVLIDLWAKVAGDEDGVYFDATWMAYCGEVVPPRIAEVWAAVSGARDAAVAFIEKAVAEKRTIRGADVDDVSRTFITQRGYGAQFLHRTGHSIGAEVHGNGVNIDNLETRDERTLIPGICFSIEPGVYLPEFGIRSEIDVYVGEGTVEVTGGAGGIQREMIRLVS
jgi:Xaa-Pro dipeptidase